MTREQERLKWQKKTKLNRAYGLVKGLVPAAKALPEVNKEEFVSVLEEVRDILAKQVGAE